MNIYALKGHKVRCHTFNAGYKYDRVVATKYLNVNEVYSVDYTEVESFSTIVVLQEFPNVRFNSVFFQDVDSQSDEDNAKHPDWIKFNQKKVKSIPMEITEITEKRPNVKLPDGTYLGKWSGNIIDLTFNDREYQLKTSISVKGFDINVVVTITDGVAKFTETKN